MTEPTQPDKSKEKLTLQITIDESKIIEAMYERVNVSYNSFRHIYDPQSFEIYDDVIEWHRRTFGASETSADMNDLIKRYKNMKEKLTTPRYQVYDTQLSATNMRITLSIMRMIYEYIVNSDDEIMKSESSNLIATKIKEAVEVDEYLLAAVDIKAMASLSNKGNVKIVERFTV